MAKGIFVILHPLVCVCVCACVCVRVLVRVCVLACTYVTAMFVARCTISVKTPPSGNRQGEMIGRLAYGHLASSPQLIRSSPMPEAGGNTPPQTLDHARQASNSCGTPQRDDIGTIKIRRGAPRSSWGAMCRKIDPRINKRAHYWGMARHHHRRPQHQRPYRHQRLRRHHPHLHGHHCQLNSRWQPHRCLGCHPR